MAYTASILSFSLENLAKTVVITGSQIPITKLRNDAQSNLWNSLLVASHFYIPEVLILFGDEVYRGNRCRKVKANEVDAFTSPNFEPLIKLGFKIKVNNQLILSPEKNKAFSVSKNFCEEIAILKYTPIFGGNMLKQFSGVENDISIVKAIIIESYGVGNLSFVDKELCETLKRLSEKNVIVINLSQCLTYQIASEYECGLFLSKFGVINGYNMTIEAALAKLSYLLGKGYDTFKVKQMMNIPLRGELTIPKISEFKFEYQIFQDSLPTLFFYNCDNEGLEVLQKIKERNLSFNFDICDLTKRNGLHYSAIKGQVEVLKFLLEFEKIRSIVNLTDKDGRTPLFDAFVSRSVECVDILIGNNGEVKAKKDDIVDLWIELLDENSIILLTKLIPCIKHLETYTDENGFNLAHYCKIKENKEIYDFLQKNDFNMNEKDFNGYKPSDLINKKEGSFF